MKKRQPLKVEQVDKELSVTLALDISLSQKKLIELFSLQFKPGIVQLERFGNHNIPYIMRGYKKQYFLIRNVTYLGIPHELYKKRIQIPKWFNEFFEKQGNTNIIHYWGLYVTKQGIVNVDFDTRNYSVNKANNSSAHVYVNDLYIGIRDGLHRKIDKNKNIITVVSSESIIDYLESMFRITEEFQYPYYDIDKKSYVAPTETFEGTDKDKIIYQVEKFNKSFDFSEKLYSTKIIKKMREEKSTNWRQPEWPGFYLEHEFEKFLKTPKNDEISFTASSNKKKNCLDFDLWFKNKKFYGDLKASTSTTSSVLLNDKISIEEAVSKYGKIWYLIYEHDTILDKEIGGNYIHTREKNDFITTEDQLKTPKDPLSYHNKMKAFVTFTNMTIVEINDYNIGIVLGVFNQGKQPSGQKRKAKSKISKNLIKKQKSLVDGSIIKDFIIYEYDRK